MTQSDRRLPDPTRRLSAVGWLSEEPAAFQAWLLAAGRWMTVERGRMLYVVGDPSDAIFGLEEGLLDVSIPISSDESVMIHRAGPDFWIGESGLLAMTTRSITVTAAVECRVFRVPLATVRRGLAEHPDYWTSFFRLSHRNATQAVQVLAEVLALTPRARFARLLLRLAGADGVVKVTQEELGHLAGMSRAAFRRAFGALISSGVVRTEYGGVRIVERAALVGEAERA